MAVSVGVAVDVRLLLRVTVEDAVAEGERVTVAVAVETGRGESKTGRPSVKEKPHRRMAISFAAAAAADGVVHLPVPPKSIGPWAA